MTARMWITFVISLATHLACLTVALLAGPSNETFPVLLLAWLSVPSTVSAIGLAPRWSPVVTAAINGLITALIVNALLLGFSWFWPFQPGQTRIMLAGTYLLLFPGIAASCGAFVAVVIRAIESGDSRSAGLIGTRKGFSFSAKCVLVTLPVLVLLLPPQSRMLLVAVAYIVGGSLLGTVVGAVTGWSYSLTRGSVSRSLNGHNSA